MRPLEEWLEEAAAFHGHLCPGQILGVRMALLGCRLLGLDPEDPGDRRRLIVYVEIDRCLTDAIAVVTGCRLGRRTLKHIDYGKAAATFVDIRTGQAVRIVARDDARETALHLAPPGLSKAAAQRHAYRIMPDEDLFRVQSVQVIIPPEDLPGHPLRRVFCVRCGEGINDGREVIRNGYILCRACAGEPYYTLLEVPAPDLHPPHS
ncbi:FmdE family protein [Thermoflexus sp.]|uniref:FmdE family protein n=1 Tax=Thermoflexus sp. TaxID=1969742 RepID=UPI0025DCF2CE|nr:FmdE family protein [Thermoflexus sp.]MDW8181000.1 FmdE family protein [Anaerolineae bacterium]MCS6963619.1 FmdE family protein [Thermoflexus sp.]MCS7351542.1 FmdE family protein [Thermoflexus sp.]MCX7691325.1 FmdE family protein [Thermoflexus sp.]MDW8184772.1 FmdE family protein [Anaerolineae bacterium]